MLNLTVTIMVFTLVGFPIMFGKIENGIIDKDYWIFTCPEENYAFFFLQIMLAAVSVTIFAGALSERTKIWPLVTAGAVSAGLIYPVFGRWAWGSMLTGEKTWLQALGFMDFAGASVVHMTAGFIALAGLVTVGPRANTNTGKSNIPLAVLGVFILWFGWFGFNGACAYNDLSIVPKVFINTSMAAAFGMLGALLINVAGRRKGGYLLSTFNGLLGGLVAVTAVSAYCSPAAAMVLGFVAGGITDLGALLMMRLGLDDVVSVVPVHLIGGITGCLLLPFTVQSSYLQAGGRFEQLAVQFIGVMVNFLWVFTISYILFRILKKLVGLRVTVEEEKKGLNIVEFSDIYSWEKYIEISAYESEIKKKNDLLRKQSRLLAVTEEQEKNKLARDLHDGVGQSLSALKLVLGMGIRQAKKTGDDAIIKTAEKASELADLSTKEMRNVLNNLKPEVLHRDGLEAALAVMVARLDNIEGMRCELTIDEPLPHFDETVELNIYRLIQECLNNVVKHSHAEKVSVICHLAKEKGRYVFEVRDDGCGFNPKSDDLGIGIPSMNDRISMLGGKFDLYSKEGEGTTVIMEVPYNEGDKNFYCR